MGNNLGRETLHLRTFCSFYCPRVAPVLQVRKSLNYWGPLRGFRYVSSLNFKTSRFAFRGGSYVTISILLLYLHFSLSLSQFQPIFVSFVTTIAAPCHCFKALSLVVFIFLSPTLSCLWQADRKWPGPYETLGFNHLRAESYYFLLLFLL